jgi:hypothetical protein
MSSTYNYVGVGVAYRSANSMTFGDIVLTESVDQTSPWTQMRSGSVSGTTVAWSWVGDDIYLQRHTSGFRSFDVEYRVDWGYWYVIRSGTRRDRCISPAGPAATITACASGPGTGEGTCRTGAPSFASGSLDGPRVRHGRASILTAWRDTPSPPST